MNSITPRHGESRPPLSDSPWFWLALFSGMACLALVAIDPKFTRRQARIEHRFENRVRARSLAAGRGAASEPTPPVTVTPGDVSDGATYGRTMDDYRPRARLSPLLLLCGGGLVAGLVGLGITRRKTGEWAVAEQPATGDTVPARASEKDPP